MSAGEVLGAHSQSGYECPFSAMPVTCTMHELVQIMETDFGDQLQTDSQGNGRISQTSQMSVSQ
jgi:hypothetical protein